MKIALKKNPQIVVRGLLLRRRVHSRAKAIMGESESVKTQDPVLSILWKWGDSQKLGSPGLG